MRGLKDLMFGLFEDHCACGLFTIKHHLLDHVCDDLENLCSIELLVAARYDHGSVVL